MRCESFVAPRKQFSLSSLSTDGEKDPIQRSLYALSSNELLLVSMCPISVWIFLERNENFLGPFHGLMLLEGLEAFIIVLKRIKCFDDLVFIQLFLKVDLKFNTWCILITRLRLTFAQISLKTTINWHKINILDFMAVSWV